MTANDSQDSMRQTVWRLSKLATSPSGLLTANGFLNRLRATMPSMRVGELQGTQLLREGYDKPVP